MVRAAVFRKGVKAGSIVEATLESCLDDEVTVRIVATGVCHTDLSCRDGKVPVGYPLILGHEGAGVVETVGARVSKVVPGDHVVLSFAFCGACSSCLAQKPCYCHEFYPLNLTGRRANGSSAMRIGTETIGAHFFGQSSFASHSVVQERNVVKVRKDAPLEYLGPLGCGVQTGAGTVMNVLRPLPGEALAVFGAGGVGLRAVMAGVVVNASPIIVIEPNAERRTLALQLGAHAAFDPNAEADLKGSVIEASRGGHLNALDTTGIPAVLSLALDTLAPRGKLALLTTIAGDAMLPLPLQVMLGKGLTVCGICEGESIADEFIPRLVDLMMAGRFPLERLVRFYDFSQLNEALDDQERSRVIKPILRMSPA